MKSLICGQILTIQNDTNMDDRADAHNPNNENYIDSDDKED